jgi:hypothetical protein
MAEIEPSCLVVHYCVETPTVDEECGGVDGPEADGKEAVEESDDSLAVVDGAEGLWGHQPLRDHVSLDGRRYDYGGVLVMAGL